MYGDLGRIQADLAWTRCGDPNGTSNKYKNLSFDKRLLDKRIKLVEFNIDLVLDENETADLKRECERMMNMTQSDSELRYSSEYTPSAFTYNADALVVRTLKPIPIDIQIGLSFGWKFLFPTTTTTENLHVVLAQLESCIKDTIDEGLHHEVFLEVARVIRSHKFPTLDVIYCIPSE